MESLAFLGFVFLAMFLVTNIITKALGPGTAPVVFLLIFSTFSGYLNNLYDRHPVIHVLRFAVLTLIALFWLLARKRTYGAAGATPTPMDNLVWSFFAFYAIQMFNPHWSGVKPAILNGLIGLATHGFPIMLFFIGREMIRTPRQISGVFFLLIALSFVMSLYGIYQHLKGYDYVVGLGPGFAMTVKRELLWRTDDFDVVVLRPMSFAPDAGTASSFYTVGILLSGALLTAARLPLVAQLLLVVGMAVMFLGLCLTLVRSSMVGTFLGLGLVVLLGKRSFRSGIALLALALVIGYFEDPTGGMLTERFKSGFNPSELGRSRGKQLEGILWASVNFPFGMGIGRGGPAGGRYNEPEDNKYTFPPESYFVTLTFETGIIGLFFAVRIFFTIATTCFQAMTQVRDPELQPLALAISVVLAAAMLVSFVGPTLYAAPLSYLFWTLAGLLFRVLELERQSRMKTRELRAQRAAAALPARG